MNETFILLKYEMGSKDIEAEAVFTKTEIKYD